MSSDSPAIDSMDARGSAPVISGRQPAEQHSLRVLILSSIRDWDLGQRLVDDGHEIVGWIFPDEDRPRHRPHPWLESLMRAANVVLSRQRPPCSLAAKFNSRDWLDARGTPIMFATDVNSTEFLELVIGRNVDVIIVAMFPQLLLPPLLSLPRISVINYHPSPLPKYAGPQPTFWMLRNGEASTAVTVHTVTEVVDGGEILAQEIVDIGSSDTNGVLLQRLHHRAAVVLTETIRRLAMRRVSPLVQEFEQRCYLGRSQASDREADWRGDAQSICNLLRAVRPWQVLRARAGRHVIVIYEAHAVERTARGVPGEIVHKQGRELVIQTSRGCVNVTCYEIEPFHGWLNRIVQLAVPRLGAQLGTARAGPA
jgi:methionyl-tRNA formyltransferase